MKRSGASWGIIAFVSAAVVGFFQQGHAGTFYVDCAVAQSGDGASWAAAFKKIQEGIDVASDGDTVIVARGTYVENIHFKGKNIILTSTDPLNASVVEKTIIDGNRAGSVVTFAGTEMESCVLSGFTIRNGSVKYGGGIRGGSEVRPWTQATIQSNVVTANWAQDGSGLYSCHGCIQNNTISGNSAGRGGGGLSECGGTIQNNTIWANRAYSGGGLAWCEGMIQNNTIEGNSAGYGGGLLYCSGTIQNNTVEWNSAYYYGGGLYSCGLAIQNNRVGGNYASRDGGGLYRCYGTIQNNTISGNSAQGDGGGLALCDGTIRNNTISGNSASRNGGGADECEGSIKNSIIWANTALGGAQLYECSQPTYSCIQGWTGGGEGNIAPPSAGFVDPDGPDGNPQTYVDNNYRLRPDSPCIDAGKSEDWMWNAGDLDGNPRISCGRSSMTVDMGAYEYRFSVMGIAAVPGGGIELTWLSASGRSYTIWWRLDLAAGEWVMGQTLPSQGDLASWTDPAPTGRVKFYCVELK